MRPAKCLESRLTCAVLIALMVIGGRFPARAESESLTYTLTPKFDEHRLRVELTWETHNRTSSILSVAQRYGRIERVENLLSNVRIDGSRSVKQDGPLWLISHAKDATLTVRYDVVSRQKTFDDWEAQQLPITTSDFFHGVGSAFLMTPNSHPGTPTEFETALRWALPAGYKSACSWGGASRSVAAKLKPADLKQSAYLAGKIVIESSGSTTPRVTVAFVDRFAFDAKQFVDFATRIIDAECKFVGERDFPEFLVTAIPAGRALREGETRVAGAGLYHGFSLFLAPQSRLSDGVEHLFAHELFHYWNGRLLAGAEPERMVYWFTEGLTDYYALRILHESGIWNAATYARWLNKHLREYAANPAQNASNEEIDKKYWTERDTVGQVAYQRGLLLGLRWHDLARQRGVKNGVDALFFSLLAKARASGAELSNEAIRRGGIETLGPWFADEFDRHVTRAMTVEVPASALMPALNGKLTEVTEKGKKLMALQFRAADAPRQKR